MQKFPGGKRRRVKKWLTDAREILILHVRRNDEGDRYTVADLYRMIEEGELEPPPVPGHSARHIVSRVFWTKAFRSTSAFKQVPRWPDQKKIRVRQYAFVHEEDNVVTLGGRHLRDWIMYNSMAC